MKTLTTTLLILSTLILNGQTTYTEISLKGESIGLELTNKKRQGFFFQIGGNVLSRTLGINQTWHQDYKSDFHSTVSWYGESGAYLPSLPPYEIFTSPNFGNRLIETGTYTSTLTMIDKHRTIVHNTINTGVVLPVGRHRVRLGGGIWITSIIGRDEYYKRTQRGRVSKYYDEWESIGNSEHLFCVEYEPTFTTVEKTTPVSILKVLPNINVAFVYNIFTDPYNPADLSFGISGKTLTIGLHYKLK